MYLAPLFLLIFAALHFHAGSFETLVLCAGYVAFAELDRWITRRRRVKVVDEELYQWEKDPRDSETEVRGNLARVRLTGENQIIAARVIQTIERLL